MQSRPLCCIFCRDELSPCRCLPCVALFEAAEVEYLPVPLPLRCTGLQKLDVEWSDTTQMSAPAALVHLQFKGSGSTPMEQHSSTQRQLAALSSSTKLLAPESWPAQSCLTSFTLDGYWPWKVTEAATRTPSMAALEVDIHEQRQQRLVTRRPRQSAASDVPRTAEQPGRARRQRHCSSWRLSGLQQLRITLELLDEEFSGDQDACRLCRPCVGVGSVLPHARGPRARPWMLV
jgi:hypothetical protein